MIHALLLVVSLGVAVGGRYGGWWLYGKQKLWWQRWPVAMLSFALPPLLLLSSTLAVVWMGVGGRMGAGDWGLYSYGLAVLALAGAALLLGWLALQGYCSERMARRLPRQPVQDYAVRVAPDASLWAAQVGWWDPCIVLSQGVLDRLRPQHLQAVLLHEHAHYVLRDPLVFLLLGWLRRLSWFLPKTAELWQELLTLRELRADAWTVRHGDSLALAEALWIFAAQAYPEVQQHWGIGLASRPTDWQERLEAILHPTSPQWGIPIVWWLLTLLPLLLVPLHH